MIFNEWKTVKVGETIISSNTGLDAIKRAPIVDYNSGIKCLRIQDISQNKNFEDWGYCLVEEKNFKKFQLVKGDIIVARTGATIGVNRLIKQNLKAVYNNGLIRIKSNADIINTDYLYYNLQSHKYKGHIQAISGGTSTQPNMKMNALLDYEIKLPSLNEQKYIAHILSTLDDKIEVNNQINKTLENMAQAIFKQWFVDFEFPNEDGEPYKSSGGKMVESDLGMIPKGWEVKGLDEIAEFLNGLAMQKYRPTENEKSYPVLKIKELRQGRTDENSDLCSSNIEKKYIVRDGDIIFSWSGSLLVDIWCGGKCGLNQHLFKVTSDKHDQWFVYQWNKYHLDRFVNIAKSKATTMGHIKRKDLSDSKVLIPSDELYLKAAQYQKYLFEKIMYSKIEIKRLEEIRDSLLPKLMSGEIRVPLDEEGDAS